MHTIKQVLLHAGGSSHINTAVNRWKLIWLAALFADILIAMCTPSTNFRLAPFFRIALFATSSSDVRRELFLLVQVIPGLSSLMLLTLLNLLFFSFFGLVLFHDVKGAAHYFGSIGKAIWQLWVLQTTCNFPDVRCPLLASSLTAACMKTSEGICAATQSCILLMLCSDIWSHEALGYADYDSCLYAKSGILLLLPGVHPDKHILLDELVHSCGVHEIY